MVSEEFVTCDWGTDPYQSSRSTMYTPIYWLGVYEGPDGPCMQVLSLRELAQPRLV